MSQQDIQLLVLLVTFAISLLQMLLSWLRDKQQIKAINTLVAQNLALDAKLDTLFEHVSNVTEELR